ncbi:MAG: S8 family serine peptidase [Chitinophagales bacterium]
MKTQADLGAASEIHGKEAKGKFVYETLASFAENSQKDLKLQLENDQVYFKSFWVTNAILVKGDAILLNKLAERTDVLKIVANSTIHKVDVVSSIPDFNRDVTIPWGIDSIHAPAVWALGYQGQGAVVGGEDTGYEWEHPAIKNQYRGWDGASVDHNYNWHDAIHAVDWHNDYDNPCGLNLQAPCDDYGHGTHTMGTMVGKEGDIEIGVAPQAKWIGERNMERGWGNLASYLESFEWFIAPTDLSNENPDPAQAPHVINNSWYCAVEEGCDPTNFSLMEEVVNNVKASGIVVVASAGNDGPACNTIMFPPALFENSFTIGAVDFLMDAASFSSRGNTQVNGIELIKPNVSAPGVDVLSSIPGDQYAYFSGTSMAGPHVAGTVALMISANPSLAGEVDLIENILEETAQPAFTFDGCGDDVSTSLPNNTFGFGIIDAFAAVQKSLLATATSAPVDPSYIRVSISPDLNQVIVQILRSNETGVFQLYNLMGQKSKDLILQPGSNSIHLSSLTGGVYLYRVNSGNKVVSGKLLKQ